MTNYHLVCAHLQLLHVIDVSAAQQSCGLWICCRRRIIMLNRNTNRVLDLVTDRLTSVLRVCGIERRLGA